MGDSADAGMDAVQRRLINECSAAEIMLILLDQLDLRGLLKLLSLVGHLMEKIEKDNLLHRAFSVFLFNSKYELLLQYPNVRSCGSKANYRPDFSNYPPRSKECSTEKALDELGIPAEDVPVDQFTPLGRMLYKAPSDGKWGEHELDYLLFIVRDVSVNPNPDEVADIKYVTGTS
ncbi:hypothetical protein F8388_009509 [Cannabis sativa]|uniref:Nudix hydrolase domain-containing protein n=1 Tax=Cannabis sativa TaxID=3483 RepID=A0A7J6H734_CANSA|nr:hypothetical protein F8388_009509 [Cannabis sativa]